ncbi:MAG: CopG family transcriptional regulator [candidate division Zixibacteria bacterium]|nr:CopG family transcriptional regulator [candidate division Zixibacteria bacterium]
MKKPKSEIITFKADESLLDALSEIPNRSEFIRIALLNALGGSCPLCTGTGILTPQQRKHWDDFTTDHSLKKCKVCHELHVVCTARPRKRIHRHTE